MSGDKGHEKQQFVAPVVGHDMSPGVLRSPDPSIYRVEPGSWEHLHDEFDRLGIIGLQVGDRMLEMVYKPGFGPDAAEQDI